MNADIHRAVAERRISPEHAADIIMERRRRKPDHTVLVYLLLAMAGFLIVLSALVGCGASAKQKTLRVAMSTLDGVVTGLETYDRQHQIDLIDQAKSLSDGKTKLLAYRSRRATILEVIIKAYQAVALAATNLSDLNLTSALELVQKVAVQAKEFTETKVEDPKLDLKPLYIEEVERPFMDFVQNGGRQ